MDAIPFAETTINNAVKMIVDVTTNRDGTPRDLPAEVLTAVLTAQTNLAIAAALMVVAQGTARRAS